MTTKERENAERLITVLIVAELISACLAFLCLFSTSAQISSCALWLGAIYFHLVAKEHIEALNQETVRCNKISAKTLEL